MKKKIGTIILAAAILFQTASLAPRRAHAIVGAVTGNGACLGAGGVLLAFGIAGFIVIGDGGIFDFRDPHSDVGARAAFISIPSVMALAGIILLDEESGAVRLGALSDDVIAGAELTEDEAMAYQLELPELNRALHYTASDLAALGVTTLEQALAHEEVWAARADGLLPETRSALRKIGAYAEHRRAR